MNALRTQLTDVERAILRHIAQQNAFDYGARIVGILNSTDDDPLTGDALASLRARGYVYTKTIERVAWAHHAGVWATVAGKMALEANDADAT